MKKFISILAALFLSICIYGNNANASTDFPKSEQAKLSFDKYTKDFMNHIKRKNYDNKVNEDNIFSYFQNKNNYIISENDNKLLNEVNENLYNKLKDGMTDKEKDEFLVADRISYDDGSVFELYKDGTFSIEKFVLDSDKDVETKAVWKNKKASVKKTFYSWIGIKTMTIGLKAIFQYNGTSNVKYLSGTAVGTVQLEGLYRQKNKHIYGYNNTPSGSRVAVMGLDVYQ